MPSRWRQIVDMDGHYIVHQFRLSINLCWKKVVHFCKDFPAKPIAHCVAKVMLMRGGVNACLRSRRNSIKITKLLTEQNCYCNREVAEFEKIGSKPFIYMVFMVASLPTYRKSSYSNRICWRKYQQL